MLIIRDLLIHYFTTLYISPSPLLYLSDMVKLIPVDLV